MKEPGCLSLSVRILRRCRYHRTSGQRFLRASRRSATKEIPMANVSCFLASFACLCLTFSYVGSNPECLLRLTKIQKLCYGQYEAEMGSAGSDHQRICNAFVRFARCMRRAKSFIYKCGEKIRTQYMKNIDKIKESARNDMSCSGVSTSGASGTVTFTVTATATDSGVTPDARPETTGAHINNNSNNNVTISLMWIYLWSLIWLHFALSW